jgi:drug/metabolite transporter (DMT)-like permease
VLPVPPSSRALPLLPAAGFVLVWSSGYVAGPYGVTGMTPLMLVAVRFFFAAVIVAILARVLRGPLRIERADAVRIALAGFVMNGVQFGAMYLAFDAGLGATLGALLHSLSPVLTALLAGIFLGERLTPLQVLGFVVGVLGVLLVLGPDIDQAGGAAGLGFAVAGVLGLSFGTLGQRWIGHAPDPLWSATIQFGVSAPPLFLLALLVEGTDVVRDPVRATIAIGYLAVINSIVGLVLLGILVRAGGAGAASSVFFLMPPVTAVLAWLAFGDTLSVREIVGLVIAVVGVAVATRSASVRDRAMAALPPGPASEPLTK